MEPAGETPDGEASFFSTYETALKRSLLGAALLAALLVYLPVLNAGWFYDDADYVVGDPRVGHLELFMPGRWSDPPPPLVGQNGGPALVLPGYDKPLISDRYLWHLSFALERKMYADPYDPNASVAAHTDNLLLHLACIALLYMALSRLIELYSAARSLDSARGRPLPGHWRFLPGLAALIFAVHPWASEPVCYVSARNGSMGTLFVLAGLIAWIEVLRAAVPLWRRILCGFLAVFCAIAAYGCKENFITAPVGYLLVVWPLLGARLWRWSKAGTLGAVVAASILAFLVAKVGIEHSDRARGLFQQTLDGNGRAYGFQIQGPLVLSTFADQVAATRVSLESNHPGWPLWACGVALAINALIILLSVGGGYFWPVLLGVTWFYLHLIPTNSILPRPDFLAGRNMYLPVAGTATVFAGAFIWLCSKLARLAGTQRIPAWLPKVAAGVCASLWLYWAVGSHNWALGFMPKEYKVWRYSAAVAPDHAAVRLNNAFTLNAISPTQSEADKKAIEVELNNAIRAEDSPTMAYHTERPKAMRRALALRLKGSLRMQEGQNEEAARNFEESFRQIPSIPAWAAWAEACIAGKKSGELSQVVDLGLQQWPNEWWPQALRGLNSIIAGTREISAGTMLDLEAAEHVSNSPVAELRSLQARALFMIANSPRARPRLGDLIQRLRELGAGEDALQRLSKLAQ